MSDVRAFSRARAGRLMRPARAGARLARDRAHDWASSVVDRVVQARGLPVVVYAALIDQESLGVCVKCRDASLVVAATPRDGSRQGASAIELGTLGHEDAPVDSVAGVISLVHILSAAVPGRFEVHGLDDRGQPSRLLWGGSRPTCPTLAPAPDGFAWDLELERRRPVVLSLRRLPGAVVVTQIVGRDDHAVIALGNPGDHAVARLRVGEELVSEIPVAGNASRGHFTIWGDDVDVPEGETARLSVATQQGEHPVRRRTLDLRDPGRGIPLPTLAPADATLARPALRLVYNAQGQLGLRRPSHAQGAAR